MLVHIVMMRVKPAFDAEEKKKHLLKIKDMLEKLPLQIDSLLMMEVGLNISTKASAFDLVLTSHFADEAALDFYRVHPAHKAVLDYMADTIGDVAAVDYRDSVR